MNPTIDNAATNRGPASEAASDPLHTAMRWIEEQEPLARLLEVTCRSCADPAVFVPAAMRLVYGSGQPNWKALCLLGSEDTRRCLNDMVRTLAALEGLSSWLVPALREGVESSVQGTDAVRLWRWTTVLVFGDQVGYEPATVLVALGRVEVLRRLRASIEVVHRACLVG